MSDLEALHAKLDAAALRLLNDAFPDTNAAEGDAPQAQALSVKERTAAFQAVHSYLSSRVKQPGAKGLSKVEQYQQSLNGGARRSRGNQAAAQTGEPTGTGSEPEHPAS